MIQENKPLLNDCELPLQAVDITHQLNSRSSRPPNFEIENAALKRLLNHHLENKNGLPQELTDIVLQICNADSAGLSFAPSDEDEPLLRWSAISGQLKNFSLDSIFQKFSPAQAVVEKKATALFEKPIRHWSDLENLEVPVYEILLTPLYYDGRAIGALWAASHKPEKKFEYEDQRVLESLAETASMVTLHHEQLLQLDRAQIKPTDERDKFLDQQNWLRQTIDRIPKPIFFLNVEAQRMWFTNLAARKMLGLIYEDELETATAQKRLTVSTIEGRILNPFELPSRRVLRGETIHGEEFILETLTGRYHIKVFAEQLPASYGQPKSAVILFQDITSLKNIENELIKTQAELNEAVEIAQIGFWSLDINTGKITVTPLLMKQFGLDLASFSGELNQALEKIDSRDRDNVINAINRSIQDHTPYNIEYRINHPDGSTYWIEAKGEIRFEKTMGSPRLTGTTIDITEAVTIRNEIEAARSLAEAASEAKSHFLANMSHEIRTPLGAIMGFADLALQSDGDKKEITNYLTVIERNSVQLLRIIDDILDLSKVEAGRVEIEEINFSLTEFIADFSSLLGFRARENGILFQIKAETDLPNVICSDPTRLRQILTNAVGNAIKFTSKGKVILHICFKNNILEFGVEDTGRGISIDQAQNLFQAFVQADASTTRKFGGTGLGLVLTKRLCQLMGGDYILERSEIGVGSKFAASIQVKVPNSAQLIAKENVKFENFNTPVMNMKSQQLKAVKVLLVEDSPDNQVLIRLILERQGVVLEMASDGFEGVNKALNNDYDVVLMDIQMPHMDGHEATQTLRAKGYQKPIVALTAHAMKEESLRAKKSGFTDFLSKPINREELVRTVSELARREN